MDRKRLSVNMICQVGAFAGTMAISFFLTPYIIAAMGRDAYGFVGLANNVISYISLFTIAINGLLVRNITVEYSRKDYHAASGYYSTAMITQTVFALILVIPLTLFAFRMDVFFQVPIDIVPDVRILWALLFLSFLAGLPAAGLSSATFATNHLDIQALITMAGIVFRAIVLIFSFAFFPAHVWYVGLANIAADAVRISCNMQAKKKLLPEVKLSMQFFEKTYIYKLLGVGIWNSFNKLQEILYTGLDLLITNLWINSTEMGTLSIAKTIPTQIISFIDMISGVFTPSMTIAYGEGNKEQFLFQTKFAMKFSGFLCSVPILGFVAFGKDFYRLWIPSLNDADVLKIQILAVFTMLPQVFSVYVYPLQVVNTITTKLKIPVLVSLALGIINVIVVLILLKTTSLGVYAVASVSSIISLFRIFLFVPLYAAWSIEMKWSTFYGPVIRGVVNTFVIGGILVVIACFFHSNSWMKLIITCGISGILTYVVCFFIVFNRRERNEVYRLINKRKTLI